MFLLSAFDSKFLLFLFVPRMLCYRFLQLHIYLMRIHLKCTSCFCSFVCMWPAFFYLYSYSVWGSWFENSLFCQSVILCKFVLFCLHFSASVIGGRRGLRCLSLLFLQHPWCSSAAFSSVQCHFHKRNSSYVVRNSAALRTQLPVSLAPSSLL